MERREFLIGAALAALLAACDRASERGATAEAGELRSTIARAPGGGSTELAVHGVNDLGATLHRATATAQPTANLVLAPASLGIALAIARTGANGVTATEMDHVLGAVDPTTLAPAMSALDQALAARSGTRPDASGTHPIEVALQLVRALWVQRDLPWSQDLLDQLAESYGAGLHTTDFTVPRDARATIDDWARTATEGRVQEILPPGAIDRRTTLLLLDAVHLRAPWLTPFESTGTGDAAFTRPDGGSITVPTMRSATQLAYAAGPGWQAVDLPYAGYELTMTILVPDPGQLGAIEAQLTPDLLTTVVATQALRTVQLALPRWSIESSVAARDALAAAGMPSAFDPGTADFTAMIEPDASVDPLLFLATVQHEASLAVDEAGSDSSAATSVASVAGGQTPTAGPVALSVDRPFLFFVRDVATGAVVFQGRVVDPSAGTG
ncbi:MAG TPA: serpin family protein [Acidimicrobiales bacterium]